MSATDLSPALSRMLDFLGALGPRWGLPAEPCRLHGYLYLVARPVTEVELDDALELTPAARDAALAWLADYGLVVRTRDGAWRTGDDPWALMLRALEARRRREMVPALALLRQCRQSARETTPREPAVGVQIDKLLALAEDLAAIDMQARRLSPARLRRIIGFGGRAARFIDRTFVRGDGNERP